MSIVAVWILNVYKIQNNKKSKEVNIKKKNYENKFKLNKIVVYSHTIFLT